MTFYRDLGPLPETIGVYYIRQQAPNESISVEQPLLPLTMRVDSRAEAGIEVNTPTMSFEEALAFADHLVDEPTDELSVMWQRSFENEFFEEPIVVPRDVLDRVIPVDSDGIYIGNATGGYWWSRGEGEDGCFVHDQLDIDANTTFDQPWIHELVAQTTDMQEHVRVAVLKDFDKLFRHFAEIQNAVA